MSLLLVEICLTITGGFMRPSFSIDDILRLVNQDRRNHGLSDLQINPVLNLAALAKADDMLNKNYFAHVSPDGTVPWHWFQYLGYQYTYAGENLASGFSNPNELENSWMQSPSHRANILSPFYSDLGLAIVQEHNANVVVEFFGSRQKQIVGYK